MKKFRFVTDCVSARGRDIQAMVDQSIDVSIRTFAKYCDIKEIAEQLGYATNKKNGLTLADDYAVRFSRSKYKGKRCYYLTHSSIEYVFVA